MRSTPPWSTPSAARRSGNLNEILALQLDPYYLAPLWPDPVSLAALQARALIDAGKATEADFAAIAARSRRDALANPKAQVAKDMPADALLEDDYVVSPAAPPRPAARSPTGPPPSCWPPATRPSSGRTRPVWITGFDHRMETHSLGARDLTIVAVDGQGRRGGRGGRRPGRRGRDPRPLRPPGDHRPGGPRASTTSVPINPSGGPLAANPMMSAGLIRIGEAAARIRSGQARRAVAHATSGPCLQQNLVCVLEGA